MVALLALSNLGTSFASAILAKDTTTNDKGQLVDKKTNNVVATTQAGETFEVHKAIQVDDSTRARKLCTGGECYDVVDSVDGLFYYLPNSDVQLLMSSCTSYADVRIRRYYKRPTTIEHQICPALSISWDTDLDNIHFHYSDGKKILIRRATAVLWSVDTRGYPGILTSGYDQACNEDGDCWGDMVCDNEHGPGKGDRVDYCNRDDDCEGNLICRSACNGQTEMFCAKELTSSPTMSTHDFKWGCGVCKEPTQTILTRE